jgi:hypothetical protein
MYTPISNNGKLPQQQAREKSLLPLVGLETVTTDISTSRCKFIETIKPPLLATFFTFTSV